MRAYCKGISKQEFVSEILLHQELDDFIKGTYDNGNKGCAVGCSLKSVSKLKDIKLDVSHHKNYETYLGVPEWLARVEDVIFEGLSLEKSKKWPLVFSKAIQEGADLDKIKIPFIVFILQSNLDRLDNLHIDLDIVKEVQHCLKLMIAAQKSEDSDLIRAAEAVAWSAVWSAKRSAEAAVWSAAEAAEAAVWSAKRSAEAAAWSAAEAAKAAAWSAAEAAKAAAEAAVWSAKRSAEAAAKAAAWSAKRSVEAAVWSAAETAEYEKIADELLRLLKECQ